MTYEAQSVMDGWLTTGDQSSLLSPVTSLAGVAEEHSALHLRTTADVHVLSPCELVLTVSCMHHSLSSIISLGMSLHYCTETLDKLQKKTVVNCCPHCILCICQKPKTALDRLIYL